MKVMVGCHIERASERTGDSGRADVASGLGDWLKGVDGVIWSF